MTSGGPGDHWATDLFQWGLPAFGEPSDSLIKDIDRLGGHRLLADDAPLGKRLGDLWPRWKRVDQDRLDRLAAELTTLRDELRTEARARGWEVD